MSAPELADFAVTADPARVASAARWNAGLQVTSLVMLLVAVGGIVAVSMTRFGGWLTIVLLGVFGAMAVGVLWTVRARRRMLRLLTAGDATLRISDQGVTVPGIGDVRAEELLFFCVTNDRARTQRMRRIPVFGWAGQAAIKAGNGTVLCDLGVRDADDLRSRASDPAAGAAITRYARRADGTRRGTVPLILDAFYDDLDTQAIVKVLFLLAQKYAIPHAVFNDAASAIRWKAPQVDDVIGAARPPAL